MNVRAIEGLVVTENTAELTVPDPRGSLRAVTLLHELRPPRRLDFTRKRPRDPWRLTLPRPDVDRMEYLLELTRRAGSTEVVPDPANPRRAAGPFGEKSVIEFPGYQEPAWVSDDDTAPGELRALPLESVRLRTRFDALLWSATDTDPARPLPLLVVHDGPEYADFSSLLRLLDHLVDFGEIPELRAVLLPPPPDRNEAYSASARYANALAADLMPAIREHAPTSAPPVLMGASLGALAALHAHFRNPGLAGGLFLQSGSFFRKRFDAQEGNFLRFARVTRFVGQLHGRAGFVAPVPTKLTCGRAEENHDNNVALAAALVRRGWPVRTAWNRDAHNWIAWRDALHPHLADLLLRVWT